MPVTSCSSINTKAYFSVSVIITSIIIPLNQVKTKEAVHGMTSFMDFMNFLSWGGESVSHFKICCKIDFHQSLYEKDAPI